MKEMMKKESIFTVTFTNGSSVFIKAMDEGHARRIVERNGSTWTRADDTVEMVIEKIEKSPELQVRLAEIKGTDIYKELQKAVAKYSGS